MQNCHKKRKFLDIPSVFGMTRNLMMLKKVHRSISNEKKLLISGCFCENQKFTADPSGEFRGRGNPPFTHTKIENREK